MIQWNGALIIISAIKGTCRDKIIKSRVWNLWQIEDRVENLIYIIK